MATHKLKIDPGYIKKISDGFMRCQIRRNDRRFI